MITLSKLPFEWLIGLRYTRAKKATRNSFISIISTISMLGIALGVAALIVVLSVMNGFQKEVRDRMLSVLSHIEVFSLDAPITDWPLIAQQSLTLKSVIGTAPYVNAQAMLTRDDVVRGVVVRGVLPEEEPKVSELDQQFKAGMLANLKAGEFGITLGKELAGALGVGLSDKVTLIAPQGNVTVAGVIPRLKQFTVVGIFESGHFEYDSGLVVMHLADAAKLFQIDGVSGVRLKVDDMHKAPEIAEKLSHLLPNGLYIRDWSRQNRTWFAAVQVEKRMMFIILTLIIAVAAFNLVSTLVMTVTDKQADIAILRTLGASPASIMKIFVVQGALVGLIGTALGVTLGVLLASNIDTVIPAIEQAFGIQFLPKDIYFISELPSDLNGRDVVVIALVSLTLSLLATLYPSYKAAQVKPAEALRYE